jgi:hypothetical protein
MTNDTFNGARLGAFTRKYFSESRDWFVGAALSLLVLILVAYLPALTGLVHPKYVIIFLVMLTSGALIVITIKAVRGYVGRKTGILDAMVPASTLEKYLVAWGVSFPVAMTLVVLSIWGVNVVLHHTTGIYISNDLFFGAAHPKGREIWDTISDKLLIAAGIHAVVFWGTLSFFSGEGMGRKALVGVIVVVAAIVLIFGLPQWLGMPANTTTGFPFFLEMKIWESRDDAHLWHTIAWAPDAWGRVLKAVVSVSVPVVFWVAGYFRLRELQVR